MIIVYNETQGTRHEFTKQEDLSEYLQGLPITDKISSYEPLDVSKSLDIGNLQGLLFGQNED